MNLYTIYDWITSLLRTRGDPTNASLATTAEQPQGKAAFVVNNVAELIPTLNFVLHEPQANVKEQSFATAIDLEYAERSRTLAANDNSERDDESNDDNSAHTYVISVNTATPTPVEQDSITETRGTTSQSIIATDSTDTSELLRQGANLCFSLTDERTLSSLSIDDPTSSITIEMAEKLTAASTATTASSSDGGMQTATSVATSGTTNRSTYITSESIAGGSGSSSVEEVIEEVIDISETSDIDVPSSSGQLVLFSESENCVVASNVTDAEDELVGVSGAAAANSSVQSGELVKDESAGKFQIDCDELSGGQLAQHFVLSDEDDSNDNETEERDATKSDSFDISLPLEKSAARIHTRHESGTREEILAQAQTLKASSEAKQTGVYSETSKDETSLKDQSTADDVSDFADELPLMGSEDDTSQNEAMPLEQTVIKSEQQAKACYVLCEDKVKSGGENERNIIEISKMTVHSNVQTEVLRSSTLPDSSSDSLVHIELDNSLEEIMASNASIEITLNPPNSSIREQNEPLVNRLFSTAADNGALLSQADKNQNDLKSVDNAPEVQTVETVICGESHEAKILEHKQLIAVETMQLKPEDDAIEEMTVIKLNANNELHNQVLKESADASRDSELSDTEDESMKLMKVHIMAMEKPAGIDPNNLSPPEFNMNLTSSATVNEIKQMDRVLETEFSKDLLEDITEESEGCKSLSTAEEQQSLELESNSKTLHQTTDCVTEEHMPNIGESSSSIVSLNMLQQLEQKVIELQNQLQSKDVCLASLSMQLEQSQRRGSNGAVSSTEHPVSARDSSSLVTNSTEYRTFQDDLSAQTLDIYLELTKRDALIVRLTDSLQKSTTSCEKLQSDSDKLNTEMLMLRKQLMEAVEKFKRPWLRNSDQESNAGQRISEISMDLISESDDDLELQLLPDNEEKYMRNSSERQLCTSRQQNFDYLPLEEPIEGPVSLRNQFQQFQKYLMPNELPLFFRVQKKFDNYLNQELEKSKLTYQQELKIAMEQWNKEKEERSQEIEKLLQAKRAQDIQHSKEMESLRKYFELKCADLEKQFSDDVFSQKSQRQGGDSSSECSEAELVYEEVGAVNHTIAQSKETSPRKRLRAQLLLSPSHRQITPCGMDTLDEQCKTNNRNIALEIAEMERFYQTRIQELKRSQEVELRKVNERLKCYECRYPEDDFVPPAKIANAEMHEKKISDAKEEDPIEEKTEGVDGDDVCVEQNTSLIIIDEDELNFNNESQVINRIIEEYERRLQEQLALARKDMVDELEQQIQNLLSDSTVNDQHWPKELILLREKFTAKSQLEITQLNIKHANEMSRLKLEYEKQLNRKSKRHLTFDSTRDLDHVISERDGLRELSKIFRNVLSQLARCVANCEEELNTTLVEEVHRLLVINRSQDAEDLEHTLSTSLLNTSLNTTSKQCRFVPNVQGLLAVVEDPSLVQFIDSKSVEDSNNHIDFDLNECLEKLKLEAAHLLQLSEDLRKQHEKEQASFSSEIEDELDAAVIEPDVAKKTTSATLESAVEVGFNLPQNAYKFLRTLSLNEQQMMGGDQHQDTNKSRPTSSLPPDLNQLKSPSSELHLQLTELKNRLIKSETDRQNLQHKLESTISRNAELGQELQVLRDQLSQLNSLNQTDYAEGYGLGAIKSAEAFSSVEHSPGSFVQLQEKARNMLSSPTQKRRSNDATMVLLQMIEDFCREGDKVVECGRRDREDLQSQYAQLEAQMRDVTQQLSDAIAKRDKFEVELKASIDKIFVLREIISDLETQIETKTLNEHVLSEKVNQLEEYIGTQNRSNETLQQEVQTLKMEFDNRYQSRICMLEEKLENVRPSAEQSMVLDQIVEQLRDVEHTLEQKTKTLESIHHTNSSNSYSISATEDISIHGLRPGSLPPVPIDSPPQGSPLHPSPRQHSITMEGVQRIVEKLDKHTRVEEAAVKRVRDLDMQLTQMRSAYMELQHERDSLQGRIDEQTQRIATLQTRLEEQRHRAEELHRAGTTDLNIRVHDLQTEMQTLNEKLSARDKQIQTMKQQLEKSKKEIDRLEARLTSEQPDASLLQRLEAEVKEKNNELQILKNKIKTDMVNRLALPDLMETVLVDKNEEIDHLRAQLDAKEKELQIALDSSHGSSLGDGIGVAGKPDASTKLSARTLSDIVSITEFDEPEAVRRVALCDVNTPLLAPKESGDFSQQTVETSKEAIANVTHKRTEELSGFMQLLNPTNTFGQSQYFQNATLQSDGTFTPGMVPRQIHFSTLEETRLKSPDQLLQSSLVQETHTKLKQEINSLKQKLTAAEQEKNLLNEKHSSDLQTMERELSGLKDEIQKRQATVEHLQKANETIKQLESALVAKSSVYEELVEKQLALETTCMAHKEQLTKQEKNLRNYAEHEEKYLERIAFLENKILEVTKQEAGEREKLRKELFSVIEAHKLCQNAHRNAEQYKRDIEKLNMDIRAKDHTLLKLTSQLAQAEEHCVELQRKLEVFEREVERLKQLQSDNSSKQFSVDEIAQQLEKELNYSAQLDSNILKAIESEEENNFDTKKQQKATMQFKGANGTDDENFAGERELLNQIEALKTQLSVEREQCDSLKQDLQGEKQHSQEIQEQDVLIIEAMRKRLENALDKEDQLHKQLDQERDHSEHLQTQLTSLQRAESRKNSSLLLKSPTDSPHKSPRSLVDFESEFGERLRSEIKLLTSQNERERERSTDIQRTGERERQRYAVELQERIEYCERLKREMEKLAREKDNANQLLEHCQERLMLQSAEIESLEARLVTFQEAETRRLNRRERHHQDSANLLAELQDMKTKLVAADCERDGLDKLIAQLRFDIESSAQREARLAEALAFANDRLNHSIDDNVPQQFLQKMKEINDLLATNTQENRQMAESMQYLVNDRQTLLKKIEELETQLGSTQNGTELEERCRHLLGRYLRVESHRKALVYQKRYLKMSLESYQESEQRAIAAIHGTYALQRPKRDKRKLFKTVALAIVAIQRIKYIGRIWSTGKRIVSKSVFTITQQKRSSPIVTCATQISRAGNYQPAPPTVNFSTMNSLNLPPDVTIKSPLKTTGLMTNNDPALTLKGTSAL